MEKYLIDFLTFCFISGFIFLLLKNNTSEKFTNMSLENTTDITDIQELNINTKALMNSSSLRVQGDSSFGMGNFSKDITVNGNANINGFLTVGNQLNAGNSITLKDGSVFGGGKLKVGNINLISKLSNLSDVIARIQIPLRGY